MATKSKKEQFAKVRKAAGTKKSAAEIAEGVTQEKAKPEPEKATEKAAPKKAATEPAKEKAGQKWVPVSFRLSEETRNKLKDLCALDRTTATAWITETIEAAYKKREAEFPKSWK